MASYISQIQMKHARKAHAEAVPIRVLAKPKAWQSPFEATDHEAIAIRAFTVLQGLLPRRGMPNPPIAGLRHRQGGVCYLCGKPLGQRLGTVGLEVSRDHVFPQAAGAKADLNILLAHAKCNGRKGDRWPRPCELIFLASVYAR